MSLCVRRSESESLSELESMDPQKRELLEARFLGKVSFTRRVTPVIDNVIMDLYSSAVWVS